MNKIKIPKKFMIGGRVVSVKVDNTLTRGHDLIGQARCRYNDILLQEMAPDGSKLPQDSIEETYLGRWCHG